MKCKLKFASIFPALQVGFCFSLSLIRGMREKTKSLLNKQGRRREKGGWWWWGVGWREISREEWRMDRETRFREERRGEFVWPLYCCRLSLPFINYYFTPPTDFHYILPLFFFKIFRIKKWLEFAFTTKRNILLHKNYFQLVWKNI